MELKTNFKDPLQKDGVIEKVLNKDDIVLFSKWEFTTDDEKCSIIHKYDHDEVKKLQREGEFPIHINLESESYR